ncbi:MAG: PspC domain-containing protein [Flavobacteriaceae bacterium]|nr:PspC domain-containing protein [Flavobacteriaceae bacterium]
MNKTININLAQIKFSLDEKGYSILKSYLNNLEQLFETTEGKEEIMEDIEGRIAEIFSQYKKYNDYVISLKEVETVIEKMGTVEDFSDNEVPKENPSSNTSKQFFRDPDDYWLGGVAGGISKYFGVDTLWIRLTLFILFIIGIPFTILFYILIWVFAPMAKTTADKIKMKGESVNISSIKNKIKEEYETVNNSVSSKSFRKFSTKIASIIIIVVKFIGKFIALFVGLILVLIPLIFFLLLIFGGLVTGIASGIFMPEDFLDFGLRINNPLFFIFGFFLIAIPLIYVFNLGIKLITKRTQLISKTTNYILIGIWIISIIFFIVIGALEFSNFINYVKTIDFEVYNNSISIRKVITKFI